ncbi:DUF983 domain-containing protein [Mucilaginibacter sp. 10I4]|uniref:DUF983 domain-containing protein n=1 Tax=Mucilaginibacter sp. 10I4 TaxID=3048580 RepID=UPI002B225EC3|nr:DUF983 domain-containing protein [Mucilaginibacter sp. 10I4]MEB0249388.1 DUF983 domain-containing protein [Mucilaginibacter sp. 5B2]MEB0260706.1 DUF983 domain-containing protein [Mucilaginibacter sp. 10I4]
MKNQENKQLKMWPAIIQAKCPRWRVGKIYANSMYSFNGQNIYKTCPHCGMTYEREPGYFYSAMYVSYAFIVAELVTLGVGTSILTGSNNPWLYIAVMLSVVVVLAPFNYRYSRVLLLHWLTPGLHYRTDLSRDHSENQST